MRVFTEIDTVELGAGLIPTLKEIKDIQKAPGMSCKEAEGSFK